MMAQDMHAVHRDSSKHTAKGSPCPVEVVFRHRDDLFRAGADAQGAALAPFTVYFRASS